MVSLPVIYSFHAPLFIKNSFLKSTTNTDKPHKLYYYTNF